jgi:hypothetical protein
MPALKARKKTSKAAKKTTSKSTKTKKAAKALKLRTTKAKTKKVARARVTRKPKQPAPRPDQTTVRLGPHHVDRHPIPPALHVHPAPPPMAMKHPNITSRHH